jgi:hypothetical protein
MARVKVKKEKTPGKNIVRAIGICDGCGDRALLFPPYETQVRKGSVKRNVKVSLCVDCYKRECDRN